MKLYGEMSGKDFKKFFGIDEQIKGAIIIGGLDYEEIFKKFERYYKLEKRILPNGIIAKYKNKKFAFFTCFGNSMAYQVSFILCKMGISPIIFIGSGGAVLSSSSIGDCFIVKSSVSYTKIPLLKKEKALKTIKLFNDALEFFRRKNVKLLHCKLYTVLDITVETSQLIKRLKRENFGCIDMEYGIIRDVCSYFGIPSIGFLLVSDNLLKGPLVTEKMKENIKKKLKKQFLKLFRISLEFLKIINEK